MKDTVSIKQIVIDFIYIREQLKELFKDKIEYQPIIEFILAKDYLNDDLDIPFPKIKDVEEGTGLKSHTLRKLLLQMHERIFSYDRKLNLSFKKVLYHFHIRYSDHSFDFTMDKLTHLPRIGENISLPFVSTFTSLNWFYVDSIKHEFAENYQVVILILKEGDYNEYWRFIKDQAIEYDDIEFRDTYSLNEAELKKIVYSKNQYRR